MALDQRGHGLSDRPDSDYTFAEVCGDLQALTEALGLKRPMLVGHSWGASVALQFASDHPQDVRALALVDGGMGEISSRLTWEETERMMMPPPIDGVAVDVFVNFARTWPQLGEAWSPQVQEMVLSNFEIRDGRVYRRLRVPNHMKVVRAMYEMKATQLYPRVRCPALLIPAFREPTSDQEKAWQNHRRDGLEAALRLLPQASLLAMEDTIHDIPVQRPKELAEAIIAFATGLP